MAQRRLALGRLEETVHPLTNDIESFAGDTPLSGGWWGVVAGAAIGIGTIIVIAP